jgi:predicted TIM-barrel fold metal-dependent hydrolase
MAIYETCSRLGCPIIILTGPYAGQDLSYTDPALIDQIAALFPQLQIVCGHGCWPFAAGILAVAFKRPNVHVSPDMYLFMPGATPYIEAMAHSSLHKQMLFATCYPLRPFRESVERVKGYGIPEANLKAVLEGNAIRLLRLAD